MVRLHGLVRTSTQLWQIRVNELAGYENGSLGHALFHFYTSNQFTPIAKMEYHDADHLILEYGSDVRSEMMLQWFVLGNGKRTFFAITACIPSAILLPEMWSKCIAAYKRGKMYQPIWHIDYRSELATPIEEVRKKVLVPIIKQTI